MICWYFARFWFFSKQKTKYVTLLALAPLVLNLQNKLIICSINIYIFSIYINKYFQIKMPTFIQILAYILDYCLKIKLNQTYYSYVSLMKMYFKSGKLYYKKVFSNLSFKLWFWLTLSTWHLEYGYLVSKKAGKRLKWANCLCCFSHLPQCVQIHRSCCSY